MTNKRSKIARIDADVKAELEAVMIKRARSGLANPLKREEVSIREALRLARTTVSWKGVLNEMSYKKKKNGK